MKSFVKRVRSKSPFRRRKNVSNIVTEIQEKEKGFFQQLTRNGAPAKADSVGEIEVVLDAKRSSTLHDLPDLAATSSASTDDVSPQKARPKPEDKESKKGKRRTFRERFMKPTTKKQQTEKQSVPETAPPRERKNEKRSPKKESVQRGRTLERSPRGRAPSPDWEQPKPACIPAVLMNSGFRKKAQRPQTIELGAQTRVSDLSMPQRIVRSESLGHESIVDVRNNLAKMEMELNTASKDGKRISRDKIMNALVHMADSLQNDERELFQKELDAWIDESVQASYPQPRRVYADESDGEEDDTFLSEASGTKGTETMVTEDDASSTDTSWMNQQQPAPNTVPDFFASLGTLFAIGEDDKNAVKEALDDLLWTEFVARNDQEALNNPDSLELELHNTPVFDPYNCGIGSSDLEPLETKKGLSWWRRKGGADNKRSRSSGASASVAAHSKSSKRDSPRKTKSESVASPPTRRRIRAPSPPPREDTESLELSSIGSSAYRIDDRYAIPKGNARSFSDSYNRMAFDRDGRVRSEFLLSSHKEEDEYSDDDNWGDMIHPAEHLNGL